MPEEQSAVSYQPQPSDVGRPALEMPHYGISFGGAIARGFKKYATFAGRASRSEYWWWTLFTFLTYLVLGLLAFAVGAATSRDGGRTPGLLAIPLIIVFAVFFLGIIVPTLALTARRWIQRAFCALAAHSLSGKPDHNDLRVVAELAGWRYLRPEAGISGIPGTSP
jgi:hypothetical protein